MPDEMMFKIPTKTPEEETARSNVAIYISLVLVLVLVGIYFYNRDRIDNVGVTDNDISDVANDFISDTSSATPEIRVDPIKGELYTEQTSSANKKPATLKSVVIPEDTVTQTNPVSNTSTEKKVISNEEYETYLNTIDRSKYPLVEIE